MKILQLIFLFDLLNKMQAILFEGFKFSIKLKLILKTNTAYCFLICEKN